MSDTLKIAREALEIGLDCAIEVAEETHLKYAGYKPHKHAAVDADVAKIKDAIAAIEAAQVEQPTLPLRPTLPSHTEPCTLEFIQWALHMERIAKSLLSAAPPAPKVEQPTLPLTDAQIAAAFEETYSRPPDIEGSDWDWRGFRRGYRVAEAAPPAAQPMTGEQIAEYLDRPGFAMDNLSPAEQRNLIGSVSELLAGAALSSEQAAPAPKVEQPTLPLSDEDNEAIRDLLGTLEKHQGTIDRCARHAKAIRALLSAAPPAPAQSLRGLCEKFKWRTDGDEATLAIRIEEHIRELKNCISAHQEVLLSEQAAPAPAQLSPKQTGGLCASCHTAAKCLYNKECDHHGYKVKTDTAELSSEQAAPAPQQPVAERFALYWIGDSDPRYVDGKNMKLCLSAEESMENVFPSQKSQYEVHRMLVYPSDAVGEQAAPAQQQPDSDQPDPAEQKPCRECDLSVGVVCDAHAAGEQPQPSLAQPEGRHCDACDWSGVDTELINGLCPECGADEADMSVGVSQPVAPDQSTKKGVQ